MTDFLSTLRAYLLGQQAVTDILGTQVIANDAPGARSSSIYVLALPAEEIALGAHQVVVLLASGGDMKTQHRTIGESRIDHVCYGATDFDAATLERAVAESVKNLTRWTWTAGGVLLHNATVARGPFQARDPEIFWPAMRRQSILRYEEREVQNATV